MQRTNTEDFKTWMEAAATEPVKITRRSGEAFVLLNVDEFEKLQVELASLRGVAKGWYLPKEVDCSSGSKPFDDY
jgi:prevent-host-death family protein